MNLSLQHCKNVGEIFCIWSELWACSFNFKGARSTCPAADFGARGDRGLFSQSRGHLRAFHQSDSGECLYHAHRSSSFSYRNSKPAHQQLLKIIFV